MNPKRIYKGEEGRQLLMQGIRDFAYAVKSTLGPSGKSVIMDHAGYGGVIGGFKATKDGVTIARSIRFEDPVKDKAALMMVQAATKTALEAGDGTTTSVVLAEAILNEFEAISKDKNIPSIEVARDLQALCDKIVSNIGRDSIPVSGDMLRQVATISANNDVKLGNQIYELFSKTDVVLVEKHSKETVKTEFVEGIKLDVGWTRPHFMNNMSNLSCELENPYVLVCDSEIKSLDGMQFLLQNEIMQQGESILIVADFSEPAMQTIVANVNKNGFKCLVIPPPAFGITRNRQVDDLAFTLGAKHFSTDTGDDYQLIRLSDLGKSVKVTATQDRTIIQLDADSVLRAKERIAELELAKKNTDEDKMDLEKRINILKGNCGIIYVGAPTQIEAEELRDRIDDAVCAVAAAKEEGIVSGGGVALFDAFRDIEGDSIAHKIMSRVILSPYNQILSNAGIIKDQKQSLFSMLFRKPNQKLMIPPHRGKGINARTGEVVNMIEAGIIDPAKVTKNAIKNATSVATTIINTSAIVSNIIKQ